jgi:hypothetical protein
MHQIKLVGSPNREPSLGYNQENSGKHPTYFDWDFDNYRGDEGRAVYLEQCIKEHARDDLVRTKIGILWECYELRPWHYEDAIAVKDSYKAIFTYDKRFVDLGPPFYYFPMGGSYISDSGMFSKSKMVSMIVGQKNITPGHNLRHQIAASIHQGIDYFALPTEPPVTNKVQALRPYFYSIIVESSKVDYWISEKLIDCLSQGTIPVYWGGGLKNSFSSHGIIRFEDVNDLKLILPNLTIDRYIQCTDAIYENIRLSRKYRCVEDWLYQHYPQFFGETI